MMGLARHDQWTADSFMSGPAPATVFPTDVRRRATSLRSLRDQLEQLQSDLRQEQAALENPAGLLAALEARAAQLAEQKATAAEALVEQKIRLQERREELAAVKEACARTEDEREALRVSESKVVDSYIRVLDPRPNARTGCLVLLATAGAATVLSLAWRTWA